MCHIHLFEIYTSVLILASESCHPFELLKSEKERSKLY